MWVPGAHRVVYHHLPGVRDLLHSNELAAASMPHNKKALSFFILLYSHMRHTVLIFSP